MENQQLWYLDNIDVNGIFCPQKSQTMNHVQKQYKKGEYIYLQNEHSDKIYFIATGKIKIGTYSPEGKEIVKSILSEGEVFGELSIIGEDKRRDFALALKTTEVCLITLEEMKSLLLEHTGLEYFMMKIIGNRLMKMESRLESLVFKDSRTRVVEYLKELALERGVRVGYETLVRGFLTHQEIANLTATSRQTVTTVLNELRNENIIYFNRQKLLIRDMEKLT